VTTLGDALYQPVVSNTSPLRHAVWIGEVEVLPALFGRIVIAARVAGELASRGAPEAVRSRIALW
jgi:predicted nucleic acid-binding protein